MGPKTGGGPVRFLAGPSSSPGSRPVRRQGLQGFRVPQPSPRSPWGSAGGFSSVLPRDQVDAMPAGRTIATSPVLSRPSRRSSLFTRFVKPGSAASRSANQRSDSCRLASAARFPGLSSTMLRANAMQNSRVQSGPAWASSRLTCAILRSIRCRSRRSATRSSRRNRCVMFMFPLREGFPAGPGALQRPTGPPGQVFGQGSALPLQCRRQSPPSPPP